jgi:hypothetical protein
VVYEARHSRGVNYALIGGVLLVSLIGFAAAGVIPTASGTSPVGLRGSSNWGQLPGTVTWDSYR